MSYLTVSNGNFESYPSFTAATNTNRRWIDGTAAGSTTTDTYKWAIALGGTATAQFDESEKHSGNASLKASLGATGSYTEIREYINSSVSQTDVETYGIAVSPSTIYKVTYWMKTNYTSGDATNGANLAALTYAATGGSALNSASGTYIKTTTDWTRYIFYITTHASAAYMMIRPTIYGHTGTATLIMDAWWDDITVEKTTLKKFNGLVKDDVKSIKGLAIASVKKVNGLDIT